MEGARGVGVAEQADNTIKMHTHCKSDLNIRRTQYEKQQKTRELKTRRRAIRNHTARPFITERPRTTLLLTRKRSIPIHHTALKTSQTRRTIRIHQTSLGLGATQAHHTLTTRRSTGIQGTSPGILGRQSAMPAVAHQTHTTLI